MSDDHAASAIGAYGKHLARLNPTPNLDKLAANGLLFENCFCTNSICSPNRYSDPKYATVIKELKQELIRQRAELNETDAKYPHIQKVIDAHWND